MVLLNGALILQAKLDALVPLVHQVLAVSECILKLLELLEHLESHIADRRRQFLRSVLLRNLGHEHFMLDGCLVHNVSLLCRPIVN